MRISRALMAESGDLHASGGPDSYLNFRARLASSWYISGVDHQMGRAG